MLEGNAANLNSSLNTPRKIPTKKAAVKNDNYIKQIRSYLGLNNDETFVSTLHSRGNGPTLSGELLVCNGDGFLIKQNGKVLDISKNDVLYITHTKLSNHVN